MQVSKTTSRIRRLFPSLDINYHNSLNTEVQKQNKAEIKKLQTKVVDSMIFGLHCNIFIAMHCNCFIFSKNKLSENLVV